MLIPPRRPRIQVLNSKNPVNPPIMKKRNQKQATAKKRTFHLLSPFIRHFLSGEEPRLSRERG